MHLDKDRFKQLVEYGVLFSIDIVLLDNQNRILLGKRVNPPAKGFWFVPGGRVYKNESLTKAFNRICMAELGQEFEYHQACLLGLFDHFYEDSVFGADVSTHYVNAPYLIMANNIKALSLPKQQHHSYRWQNINEIEQDDSVHQYSKVFLNALKHHIEQGQYKGEIA